MAIFQTNVTKLPTSLRIFLDVFENSKKTQLKKKLPDISLVFSTGFDSEKTEEEKCRIVLRDNG